VCVFNLTERVTKLVNLDFFLYIHSSEDDIIVLNQFK